MAAFQPQALAFGTLQQLHEVNGNRFFPNTFKGDQFPSNTTCQNNQAQVSSQLHATGDLRQPPSVVANSFHQPTYNANVSSQRGTHVYWENEHHRTTQNIPSAPPIHLLNPGSYAHRSAAAEASAVFLNNRCVTTEDSLASALDAFSMVRHKRTDRLMELLDRGLPVDVCDRTGNSLLVIACQNGHRSLAKKLLRRGANIHHANYRGNTALHFACRYFGESSQIAAYLVRKGASISARNSDGSTPFQVSICSRGSS